MASSLHHDYLAVSLPYTFDIIFLIRRCTNVGLAQLPHKSESLPKVLFTALQASGIDYGHCDHTGKCSAFYDSTSEARTFFPFLSPASSMSNASYYR